MDLLKSFCRMLERLLCIVLGLSLGLSIAFVSCMPTKSGSKVKDVSENNEQQKEIISCEKPTIEIEDTEISDDCATEKSKYIIYVDAGHGFDVETYDKRWKYGFAEFGAIGEADYVEELSLLLKERLQEEGYKVKLLSDFEIDGVQASREFVGNTGRRDLFKNSNCNVMIQLHYDASDDITCRGGHVIYSPMSVGSEKLARCIIQEFKYNNLRLNSMYDKSDYVSKRDGLAVYNRFINKPLVLVECGYGCVGALDHNYLNKVETKQKLVDSIVFGLNDYFSISVINKF